MEMTVISSCKFMKVCTFISSHTKTDINRNACIYISLKHCILKSVALCRGVTYAKFIGYENLWRYPYLCIGVHSSAEEERGLQTSVEACKDLRGFTYVCKLLWGSQRSEKVVKGCKKFANIHGCLQR